MSITEVILVLYVTTITWYLISRICEVVETCHYAKYCSKEIMKVNLEREEK